MNDIKAFELSSAETTTEKNDVRDYFKITIFQKEASQVDEDKSHPWEKVHNSFYVKNEYGVIVAGECYEGRDLPLSLLLAEKTVDGQHTSMYHRTLSRQQMGNISNAIDTFTPHLEDKTRHAFIRKIIQLSQEITPEELMAEKTSMCLLDILPDINSSISIEDEPLINSLLEQVDQEKKIQLGNFLAKAAKKMPVELFREKLKNLNESLVFRHDPFGKFYPQLFFEITEWVINSRDDTKINYSLLQRPELEKYFVKDQVRRTFKSKEELASVLFALPIESFPDIKNKEVGLRHPEMVDLDLLIGGQTIENWNVSTSEGRGLERIFQLATEFQNGTRDVVGRGDPIDAIKINGKYYVNSDGRHRTAALKALGVKNVPMLVSEVV